MLRNSNIALLFAASALSALLISGCSLGLDFDAIQPECGEGLTAVDGDCTCPDGLPATADLQSCICPGDRQFNPIAPHCTCPGQLVELGDECGCPGRLLPGAEPNTCVCADTFVPSEQDPFCICPAPRTEVDGVCTCPGDAEPSSDGTCQCPSNYVFQESEPYCGCPQGLDDTGSGCECPAGLGLAADQQTCLCSENLNWIPSLASCGCNAPWVLRSEMVNGAPVERCGCPIEIGPEQPFAWPEDGVEECTGRIEEVGVLGDGVLQVTHARALQLEPDRWAVAVVQQSQLNVTVRLYEIAIDGNGEATISEVEDPVSFPRADASGNLAAEGSVVGLSLFTFEGVQVPIVFQSDGIITWIDYSASAGMEPRELPAAGVGSKVSRASSGPPWGGALFSGTIPYLVEQANISGENVVALGAVEYAVFSLDARAVFGFGRFSWNGADAEPLSMEFDTVIVPADSARNGNFSAFDIEGAIFLDITPFEAGNFVLASGVSSRLVYDNSTTDENPDVGSIPGCPAMDMMMNPIGCLEFRDAKPALFQFEYSSNLSGFATLESDDIDILDLYPQTITESTDYIENAFGMAPSEPDKFIFVGVSAGGAESQIISAIIPGYLRCRSETGFEPCDFANANTPEEAAEIPTPVYLPLTMVSWDRDISTIAPIEHVQLDSAIGDVTALSSSALALDDRTRLFGLLRYQLEGNGTNSRQSLSIVDASSALNQVRADYELQSAVELPTLPPDLLSSGPFLFVSVDRGLLVLRIFGGTP